MLPKILFYRFWHFFWFFALPLSIAWAIVDISVRARWVEEMEVWHVLLIFAALAYGLYSLREKLPFWQDRDPNSVYNRGRKAKELAEYLKTVEKRIAKKQKKLSKEARSQLTEAVAKLHAAIASGDPAAVDVAAKQLEGSTQKHLDAGGKSSSREFAFQIGFAIFVAFFLRLFVMEAFKIPSESMVPTLMVGDHIFVSKFLYGLSAPFSHKRLVRFAKPNYGDVIVFLKPSREQQGNFQPSEYEMGGEDDMVGVDFIKRIAALPGDKVSMRSDILYINGKPLPRCKVGTQTYRTRNYFNDTWVDHQAELWVERNGDRQYTIIEETTGPKYNFAPFTVPNDQVFVLGDNRDNSRDSRFWGSVPFDNIKGRALFIWWSNRRPYGFQWDRVGTFIMSEPKLSQEQQAALANCPELQ